MISKSIYVHILMCRFTDGTSQCGFKIKYQVKNCRLKVYTLGEHSHENEIRKRGLKWEKASKLLEVMPTSK